VKNRSHSYAIFDSITGQLLWVFETKQLCTNLMNIHHSTLNKCVNANTTYLNSFRLSRTGITETPAIQNLDVFLLFVYKNVNNLNHISIEIKKFKKFPFFSTHD
jgi:hypothetical protein